MVIHDDDEDRTVQADVLTGVSSLAELCDLLSAHKSLLYEYFADWYLRHKREIKSVKDYLELLFPAWYFVEPEAFLTATKFLVYSCSGYISERKPTVLKRWHLPQRILRES